MLDPCLVARSHRSTVPCLAVVGKARHAPAKTRAPSYSHEGNAWVATRMAGGDSRCTLLFPGSARSFKGEEAAGLLGSVGDIHAYVSTQATTNVLD